MQFITPKATDTPSALGVQPGWYVRHACCSIWFEVEYVMSDRWIVCVARDPKKRTTLVTIGDNYSSVNEFCTAKPKGLSWISKGRLKSFYDKFFPEKDRIVSDASSPA